MKINKSILTINKIYIKQLLKFHIILILLFFIFNCRTITLNQKADTLEKKQNEISGVSNIGAGLLLTKYPYGFVSAGFFYRRGLLDNLEFQLKHDIIFIVSQGFMLESHFYSGLKIRVFRSENSNLALLPLIGLWVEYPMTYVDMGFNLGFTLIGDYKNFYWGIPLNAKVDLLSTIEDLSSYHEISCNNQLTKVYDVELPSFEAGFVLGGEYLKKSFVMRNEFAFTFSGEFRYSNADINEDCTNPFLKHYLYLNFSYSIAIGKRFF